MKKFLTLAVFVLAALSVSAQMTSNQQGQYFNTADNVLARNSKLSIGGYGEIHYNQGLANQERSNGLMDVHRMVMMFGYNFNEKTQFITELEFEHVKEIYVEQAFLQYKLNSMVNFRAGLMLIPMGIVNEYHEPVAFNGVERPLIDGVIAPSTWREIGAGITGNILPLSLKYQAYIVNGFNGYNGSAKLNGKKGYRSGRQKGAESYISSPNLSAKVEYFGIKGLNIGLSGYFGKTQSTLYNGIADSDDAALAMADSSSVGISMLGADARYTNGGLQLRGQLYVSSNSNVDQYNDFTGSDLGSAMYGYYVEAAYDVFNGSELDGQLLPFIRYSEYDTHSSVSGNVTKNDDYKLTAITTGLGWKITPGAIVKADLQFTETASGKFKRTFNAGVGVMF